MKTISLLAAAITMLAISTVPSSAACGAKTPNQCTSLSSAVSPGEKPKMPV